jgi:hypothetical protein
MLPVNMFVVSTEMKEGGVWDMTMCSVPYAFEPEILYVRADSVETTIENLKNMIADSYNEGFLQGMKEVTSRKGGVPWSDSKIRKQIAKVI